MYLHFADPYINVSLCLCIIPRGNLVDVKFSHTNLTPSLAVRVNADAAVVKERRRIGVLRDTVLCLHRTVPKHLPLKSSRDHDATLSINIHATYIQFLKNLKGVRCVPESDKLYKNKRRRFEGVVKHVKI